MTRRFNTIYLLYIACVFSVLLSSCEEGKEDNELNSGQLIGFIGLVDVDNHEITDRSGVEITLDNGFSQITTQSDNSGKFSFDGLEAGTYNILFNKDSFYQEKIQGFTFAGGSLPMTLYRTFLYQKYNAQIDSLLLSVNNWSSQNFELSLTLIGSNIINKEAPFFRFYVSNTPDVSYKNYLATFYNNYHYVVDDKFITLGFIDTNIFPIGSTIYVIAYPATNTNYSFYNTTYKHVYFDLTTGAEIYTAVNIEKASNIESIVVPERNMFKYTEK